MPGMLIRDAERMLGELGFDALQFDDSTIGETRASVIPKARLVDDMDALWFTIEARASRRDESHLQKRQELAAGRLVEFVEALVGKEADHAS